MTSRVLLCIGLELQMEKHKGKGKGKQVASPNLSGRLKKPKQSLQQTKAVEVGDQKS